MGELEERARSWPSPAHLVSGSLGILIRQKYFPVSSLQTLTRSQLQVVAAFLLLGITTSSLLEPLVTNLLQHAVHSSRRALGWRRRSEQGKRWRESPICGGQEGKNARCSGEAKPTP